MPKLNIGIVKNLWLGFIFAFFACNQPQNGAQRPLRAANGAEPQSIDPHKCTGHPGIRIIGALFEGLVARNPATGGVLPAVAKSWEVSEDQKSYTFHIRKTVWSDGEPVTAGDFAESWKRLLNPQTGAEYASLLNILRNGEQVIKGMYPVDSLGVEAPDDSTFIAHLISPTGYFLSLCAFEPLFPVPLKTVAAHGDRWTASESIVSNGPFVLKHWSPNKIMQLEKNPRYWDSAAVKQKKIEIYPIDHQETAYKMFLNAELDWIFSIPLSKMEAARKKPEYVNSIQYGVYYYSLNVTKPELQNPFLRKALALSLDREKIVTYVTKGGEVPATGFVPILPSIPYRGVQSNLYNPQLAKKMLQKAGYGPSNPVPKLQLLYNTSEGHKKIAEVVTQMWKEELGIEVELLNYEWKIYLQSTKNLQHTIARASWIADYPDPYSFLELAVSSNGNNRSGYNNPKYDQCMERSQFMVVVEERMEQLAACEQMLMEDMPIIPVYYYAINELRSPRLKGATLNPMGMYPWKHVHLESF